MVEVVRYLWLFPDRSRLDRKRKNRDEMESLEKGGSDKRTRQAAHTTTSVAANRFLVMCLLLPNLSAHIHSVYS